MPGKRHSATSARASLALTGRAIDGTRHESDTVIYELHVRAFTQNPNSGVSDDGRGTYRGVIEKIPYLNDPKEGSHWGYMPSGRGVSLACHNAGGSR